MGSQLYLWRMTDKMLSQSPFLKDLSDKMVLGQPEKICLDFQPRHIFQEGMDDIFDFEKKNRSIFTASKFAEASSPWTWNTVVLVLMEHKSIKYVSLA